MWSQTFDAEERAGGRSVTVGSAQALLAVVLGGAILIAEVVLSLQVTSREVTVRGGSWALGLLSLALGFLGPYAVIVAWRARPDDARSPVQRGLASGIAATVAGGMAIAWLLLIHSSLHPKLLPF